MAKQPLVIQPHDEFREAEVWEVVNETFDFIAENPTAGDEFYVLEERINWGLEKLSKSFPGSPRHLGLASENMDFRSLIADAALLLEQALYIESGYPAPLIFSTDDQCHEADWFAVIANWAIRTEPLAALGQRGRRLNTVDAMYGVAVLSLARGLTWAQCEEVSETLNYCLVGAQFLSLADMHGASREISKDGFNLAKELERVSLASNAAKAKANRSNQVWRWACPKIHDEILRSGDTQEVVIDRLAPEIIKFAQLQGVFLAETNIVNLGKRRYTTWRRDTGIPVGGRGRPRKK